MNTITKALGSIAIAGIVATGGTAFTAGGMSLTANPASAFIGGTVNQSSTGANLTNVVYAVTNTGAAQESVTGITLSFLASVENRAVTVVLTSGGGTPVTESLTCTVGGTPFQTATCTPAANGGLFADLQSIAVKVA